MVIPVFNEEKNIKAVLDEHLARLKDVAGWELVVLDDASTDRTWDILQEYARSYPGLRLLRHETNQGISPSFQRLFQEARGDYVYATAGDGQWPAENLSRLWKSRQETGADLVVGVRQGRQKVYGIGRRVLSYGFNYLARTKLRLDVQDVNGIKLGRREIFTAAVRSRSYFAEVERLALAQKKGFRIVCAPVIFLPRPHGTAKGARWGSILLTLSDFVRLSK